MGRIPPIASSRSASKASPGGEPRSDPAAGAARGRPSATGGRR